MLQGLQETLDEDWMNLPYRNLGRDDRVVSDHGRQLRTPYLDENVVKFVRALECWEKYDYHKLILKFFINNFSEHSHQTVFPEA